MTIAEKYRVLHALGQGAMGSVWAVRNEWTERRVAMKVVRGGEEDPDLKSRLLREARAAGRVSHRHVVQVFDVGELEDGSPFLVMELLSGETLADRLDRGALSVTEALELAAGVASGLAAAHDEGIVHRDLKPANLFLHEESDGHIVIKVLDFGVSKVLWSNAPSRSVSGWAVGTPSYMSPEQARGDRDLDLRSDLWSFGVVFFEALAGFRPFDARTSFQTAANILDGELPQLDEQTAETHSVLAGVISQCMQRDADRRPNSAKDLVNLLQPELERHRRANPNLQPEQVAPTLASKRLVGATKARKAISSKREARVGVSEPDATRSGECSNGALVASAAGNRRRRTTLASIIAAAALVVGGVAYLALQDRSDVPDDGSQAVLGASQLAAPAIVEPAVDADVDVGFDFDADRVAGPAASTRKDASTGVSPSPPLAAPAAPSAQPDAPALTRIRRARAASAKKTREERGKSQSEVRPTSPTPEAGTRRGKCEPGSLAPNCFGLLDD